MLAIHPLVRRTGLHRCYSPTALAPNLLTLHGGSLSLYTCVCVCAYEINVHKFDIFTKCARLHWLWVHQQTNDKNLNPFFNKHSGAMKKVRCPKRQRLHVRVFCSRLGVRRHSQDGVARSQQRSLPRARRLAIVPIAAMRLNQKKTSKSFKALGFISPRLYKPSA